MLSCRPTSLEIRHPTSLIWSSTASKRIQNKMSNPKAKTAEMLKVRVKNSQKMRWLMRTITTITKFRMRWRMRKNRTTRYRMRGRRRLKMPFMSWRRLRRGRIAMILIGRMMILILMTPWKVLRNWRISPPTEPKGKKGKLKTWLNFPTEDPGRARCLMKPLRLLGGRRRRGRESSTWRNRLRLMRKQQLIRFWMKQGEN